MTLSEAISHCKENAYKERKNCNHKCAEEHEQLMRWLEQLRELIGDGENG